VNDLAAKELAKRTLTTLYNQKPTWLINAHATLDAAVSTAYGWELGLSDDEIVNRLLVLNRERVGATLPVKESRVES